MKQLSIFDDSLVIPGLGYIEEYITIEQERLLMELIDNNMWITELKRRTQHYGYKYDYKSRSIDQYHYLGLVPEWLDLLCDKLYNSKIFDQKPDQVIVNEYMPGQGIAPHIDCVPCFSDIICSLSLHSACVMDFSKGSIKHSMTLQPRSLLVLKSDARYQWRHAIAPRKSDNKIARSRRVSLTFRKVIL
jgi:alkylated DNA repair dioxygenase AlkB